MNILIKKLVLYTILILLKYTNNHKCSHNDIKVNLSISDYNGKYITESDIKKRMKENIKNRFMQDTYNNNKNYNNFYNSNTYNSNFDYTDNSLFYDIIEKFFNPNNLPKDDLNFARSKYDDIPYEPIRIKADYTYIDNDETISDLWKSNVKLAIQKAIEVFEGILTIKRSYTKIVVDSCLIDNFIVPEFYRSEGFDTDLLIFVIPEDRQEYTAKNIEAWAAACTLQYYDKRPNVGVIAISKQSINIAKENSLTYLTRLILHEMTHILAFSPTLFNYYWDPINKVTMDISQVLVENIYINGLPRNLIKTPRVINAAIQHFGCSDVLGMELENQGLTVSVGSHWESRVMLGDYMISTSYEDSSISDITLALFEDSGWYKINKYYNGGLFKFGNNQGCDFLYSKCLNKQNENNQLGILKRVNQYSDIKPNSKYFCSIDNQPLCMSDNKNKGACQINKDLNIKENSYNYFDNKLVGGYMPADYCPIPRKYVNENTGSYYYPGHCTYGLKNTLPDQMHESISENSGCFISSLYSNLNNTEITIAMQSICYEYKCNYNITSVVIKINNTTVRCPPEGGAVKVNGYSGELICPDFNSYCSSTKQCYDIIDCFEKKSELSKDVVLKNTEELDDIYQQKISYGYYDFKTNQIMYYKQALNNTKFTNINMSDINNLNQTSNFTIGYYDIEQTFNEFSTLIPESKVEMLDNMIINGKMISNESFTLTINLALYFTIIFVNFV